MGSMNFGSFVDRKHAILHRLLLRLHTIEVTSGISILQGQMKSESDRKPSPHCGPVLYLLALGLSPSSELAEKELLGEACGNPFGSTDCKIAKN
jgi:hypothetical protein